MKPKKLEREATFSTYLLFYFGIAILFGCLLLEKNDEHGHWVELGIHLGQAFIIGSTISALIDLPQIVNYFKKITIQSLVSQEYLQSLPREKLLELRKECTSQIHLSGTQYSEPGLINLDEKVAELLTMPYHDLYRQTVVCRTDGEFVVKRHHIEEYIVNPLSKRNTYVKWGDKTKNFIFKTADEALTDVIKFSRFIIRVDDDAEVDLLKQGIKLKETPYETSDMTYTTQVVLTNNEDKPIEVEFLKFIRIERTYEIKVPKKDRTFQKRLTTPTKSFRLDYHYPDANVELIASCFGTLSYLQDGGIRTIHEEDHISVESYNWLLPGNGVFVVHA